MHIGKTGSFSPVNSLLFLPGDQTEEDSCLSFNNPKERFSKFSVDSCSLQFPIICFSSNGLCLRFQMVSQKHNQHQSLQLSTSLWLLRLRRWTVQENTENWDLIGKNRRDCPQWYRNKRKMETVGRFLSTWNNTSSVTSCVLVPRIQPWVPHHNSSYVLLSLHDPESNSTFGSGKTLWVSYYFLSLVLNAFMLHGAIAVSQHCAIFTYRKSFDWINCCCTTWHVMHFAAEMFHMVRIQNSDTLMFPDPLTFIAKFKTLGGTCFLKERATTQRVECSTCPLPSPPTVLVFTGYWRSSGPPKSSDWFVCGKIAELWAFSRGNLSCALSWVPISAAPSIAEAAN